MSEPMLLDRAGRRRSPATMPGFHVGRAPHNQGLRYPADPPKVEEIISVMHAAGDDAHGRRLRGLIVVLWRPGCASRKRSPEATARGGIYAQSLADFSTSILAISPSPKV
jgi:hypothetical protein